MSSTHPLKMALQAVLAGTSQFVELRDPFHPAGFPEFARAFLERWRDDRNTKNAKYWDRLVASVEKRGKSHQHIQQKVERLLDLVHSSLAMSYFLRGQRKAVLTLLGEVRELAAKEQAQITAFTELSGDQFPPSALLERLRQEETKLERWLLLFPGTRQSRSRARPGSPGGVREDVSRKAFMQALSHIMRTWFGQPNDPIVAAMTTLAFPEDEATERDVRHAREAPAVTPLASPEACDAALNSLDVEAILRVLAQDRIVTAVNSLDPKRRSDPEGTAKLDRGK
jgi:hypothetical protein